MTDILQMPCDELMRYPQIPLQGTRERYPMLEGERSVAAALGARVACIR